MSDTIITVEGLGKKYSLRHQTGDRYTALRDVISDKTKSLFRRRNGRQAPTSALGYLSSAPASREDFWALKDVSFEVRQGEVVGIIGRNGAGKSTLLKILSRITDPTEGRIRIKGRVASLLEVGTGFHPELTGRENIFLNGAILGMTRAEIKTKFDEIVSFAEVEKFLDTPVKRYSSGMYVRLAFAVAAHLEPEILVVDEVLAVGDAEFQRKCLGKMKEVSRGGRTVLFVSHNMGSVAALCSRALLLSHGRVHMDGTAIEVCAAYTTGVSLERARSVTFIPRTESKLSFLAAEVLGSQKSSSERLQIDDQITISIRYRIDVSVVGVVLGIRVRRDGILLFNSFDTDENPERLTTRSPGQYEALLPLPRFLFVAGRYSVSLLASMPSTEQLDEQIDALFFEIEEDGHEVSLKSYCKARGGMLILPLKWKIQQLQAPCITVPARSVPGPS